MKICMYGAGAIGGYLGVELALAGYDVSLIARGPHLEAIRAKGLTLLIDGEEKVVDIRATDNPTQLEPQDYVFLTMKAHAVGAVLDAIQPLLGSETAVITAQNGIPWWYFYGLAGPFEHARLESVDPGHQISDKIGPERAIGCVVYPSCEMVAPGVIEYGYGKRFMLGEPDGSRSERVKVVSRALTNAGFKAPVRKRIRDDIWLKLWGNLGFNPVSVLTTATLEQMANHEGVHAVIREMMTEAQAVAEKLGAKFLVDVETRIGWGRDAGAHKTSMLQDLERGRPMEIAPIVSAVSEMGGLTDVPTPIIDTVLALIQLRAQLNS